MKTILLGNAGAGKSTMAKAIMGSTSIPRLSLDEIAWSEPAIRMPLAQSVELLLAFIDEHESWILEGCYGDIIEAALPHCHELIFLNPGIDVCIKHCHMRPWEPEKFESPEQQDSNLKNLINWVKEYETRDDEYGLKRHRQLFDSFKGNKQEFNKVSEYKIV
jgi:adenylate kinase family enzyme